MPYSTCTCCTPVATNQPITLIVPQHQRGGLQLCCALVVDNPLPCASDMVLLLLLLLLLVVVVSAVLLLL